jgi:NAD(P)-dependent dehydrogenase (short-subunit alcohol dehydrogenase family)
LGDIISISSSAGPSGFELGTAYAASKFDLEGWMESLHAEVASAEGSSSSLGKLRTASNPATRRSSRERS